MAKMMLSAGMSSTCASSNVGLKRAVGVEDRGAAHGPQAGQLAVLNEDLARPALIVQVDAFFGAFVDFDLVGGHLLAAFQADHVDLLVAAEAQGGASHVVGHMLIVRTNGGARHVVGDVAAADHDDALAQRQGRAGVEGAQEIHAVDDVLIVCARKSQFAALGKTDAEEDGGVAFLAQAGDREIAAQAHVALEFHAEREDGLDLVADQFARQAEDRNSGGQHAARFGVAFEDGDLVADLDQVVRHGESADTGADDGHALVVAAIGRQHLIVVRLAIERVIAGLRTEAAGDEALERAYAHRRIDIAPPAGGLARGAADAPADGGEWIVRAGDPVGVLVAAFGDGRDVAAGIGVHRAGMPALHHLHPVIGRVRNA